MSTTLPATLPKAVSAAQQQHIVNIVRRAAKAEIMPRFRSLSASDIRTKSHANDLVTAADTAAEMMITRALQIAFPTALVVGEEAVADNPALLDQIADAPLAFIIDPIDGTWNYAHGMAIFGVIIAVTQFGKPAFGLIYDPVADDWVIADEETPARMETAANNPRTLKASMGKPLGALIGYVPLHMFAKEHQAKMAVALTGFTRSHPLGCSAHEYRMIAQGHTDFLLTASLHPWDHAAGALICERAGAHVEMLDGGPYSADRRSGHLMVAPDRTTWNRLKKVFTFLLDQP
ncbi:inositol monophosphatase family protein [Sulfitobacter geojensis]|uniref:Inositol monophosphatase n=1 Tax=Sulfitobacter geojensis TaxID=1342299 RepID=A0AAE3B7Q3_9RHOB|nr:inositol monophosphatase [Sulfitobacter geojensis]MBM1690425.1 inositol monophosphatase [Sulfitobacter geojensis]MBM1694491.1 inositol monophosphatase [Sulfitobacter geojensis]MBM1706657.1 inositol monophosphatase [Sulfitobacter geojensis]MBM1710715.1 inositol monophosphatase [Sulfitobacter geojensis]MBM1714781.1 inositol monophosphatase [Sulfitobacter geojensis]